jgi:hypothetical protein
MAYRSAARTLADLRLLLEKLEQNRDSYDQVSFVQLRRIMHRRILALTAELGSKPDPIQERPAA